jgi:hypothetical protein
MFSTEYSFDYIVPDERNRRIETAIELLGRPEGCLLLDDLFALLTAGNVVFYVVNGLWSNTIESIEIIGTAQDRLVLTDFYASSHYKDLNLVPNHYNLTFVFFDKTCAEKYILKIKEYNI